MFLKNEDNFQAETFLSSQAFSCRSDSSPCAVIAVCCVRVSLAPLTEASACGFIRMHPGSCDISLAIAGESEMGLIKMMRFV